METLFLSGPWLGRQVVARRGSDDTACREQLVKLDFGVSIYKQGLLSVLFLDQTRFPVLIKFHSYSSVTDIAMSLRV